MILCSTPAPFGKEPPSQKGQESDDSSYTDEDARDGRSGEVRSILIWHIRG